jgi:hypothetical protein
MIVKINNVPLLPTILANPIFDVRKWAEEHTKDFLLGVLDAIGDVLVDLSYSIVLVGSGLCILFTVVGWKEGRKWTGILLLAYALIRFLLGGA